MNASTLPVTSHDPAAGARNLLLGCAGVRAGDSLLLIVEPEGNTHYEPALAPFIARQARALGASVRLMPVAPAGGPESVPAEVMHAIGAADHTIFLNRIGDQVRFAPLPGTGTKTMCYALDMQFLGSEFATTPYSIWEGIQARVTAQLDSARRYTIRCPKGTDLSMRLAGSRIAQQRTGDFTVKNFPVMIVPPVPASGLSGRLVLSQALTSTYVHAYEHSILPLTSPLALTLEDGQIVRIEGEESLVARAQAQFARVGALFGGRPWALNSWHAGINAFTFFPRPALSDIDRWSCVAFGSPRYAHFHMCGPAPGDICGQIFDPTIAFDDVVLWRDGHPAFLTPADRQSLIEHSRLSPDTFQTRRDLGVGAS
jgi:hypothetical protein